MKNALVLIAILFASCTVSIVPSEQKFWSSEYIIEEAYTKSTKQKMPIEGARLKFLKEKAVILNFDNEEFQGKWKITDYSTDEFGSMIETLQIDVKDKNNQRILFGQTENFRKQNMTLRGNIDGKTRIFKLVRLQ